jgi:L-lactate permease
VYLAFHQGYQPVAGSVIASALVAMLPLVLLFVLLALLRVPAWIDLSVGAAGVNRVGAEGEIFRRTIGHGLILTSLIGALPWSRPTCCRP